MDESGVRLPQQFLADLTQAMRSTAEMARQETLVDCKTAAAARVERLKSGTTEEADDLRRDAEADVAAIREQSKTEMAQIRTETERRISLRREALERELRELTSEIDLEISTVQDRVTAFELEVTRFFEHLLEGSDPTELATMACQIPDSPFFADPDRAALAAQLRVDQEPAADPDDRVELPAGQEVEAPQVLPDHWWMDSPATLAARMRGDQP